MVVARAARHLNEALGVEISKVMHMNQIFTIRPYLWQGVWVFDDPAVGLSREALVSGVPELIRMATEEAGITNPEQGFVVLFSKDPFPSARIELQWVREESGGNTYAWRGQAGWLCPALFRYFDHAPQTLYLEVRPAEDRTDFNSWFTTRMQQAAQQINGLLGHQGIHRWAEAQEWLRNFAYEAWQAGQQLRESTRETSKQKP
jgi:hypothetical protein